MAATHNPPHPGEVLWELHLKESGTSVSEAALRLGVARQAMSAILNGRAGISADMALRLADALRTSAEMWTRMQSAYDLWQAKRKKRPKVKTLLHAAARGLTGITGRINWCPNCRYRKGLTWNT